jgi:hypothetical protein
VSLAWHEAPHSGSDQNQESVMKTIVSALTALSVLGLVAPPASAFDAKFLWVPRARWRY